MSGWFAVSRGITAHPLFKGKPERLAVWMWLLDNAVWRDAKHDVKGHTVDVPRGSVCASERHISEQCGVGYQVVRTAIKRFKGERMINATPTHGKNIITLCNYEKYQDPNKASNATLTQPQRNPNAQKEQGNNIHKKEDTNVSLVQSPNFSKQDFQDFWDAYPHRNGKKNRAGSEASFKRAVKSGVTIQQIAAGVENMRNDPNVQRGFARDPVTWLNQKGWDDEFSPQPQFKAMNGEQHGQIANNTGRSEIGKRADPALKQALRLTGLEGT